MSDTAKKPQLRMVEVTRASYESGQAFSDWEGESGFARIGGSFGDMLLSSPVRDQHDDDLLLLAALLDNRPIGVIHTFNGKLHVGAQTVDMLWGSGLVVLPEHRNTGAGLMILLRLRSQAIASGGVGVSQLALPIYRQLGWQHIAADRHLLVLRSAPILKRWIRWPWLLKLVGTLVDLGLLLHRLVVSALIRMRLSGYQIEAIEKMPDELDPLIQGLTRPIKCHRSAEWLNWAMHTGPQNNGRKLYLVKNRDGRPVGYFMTRIMQHKEADQGRIRDIRLASVLDWMSFDDELDDSAIALLALNKLLDADADAIELCVPEAKTGKALRKLGMLRKGALNMVIRFPAGTPGVDELKMDGDNFWFRPADADGFVN